VAAKQPPKNVKVLAIERLRSINAAKEKALRSVIPKVAQNDYRRWITEP